jgi:hypothetical protein
MRTNIEIDDQLVDQAMRTSGTRTGNANQRYSHQKGRCRAGLRLLVQTHSQTAIRRLRGKVQWEGALNESRLGHVEE